MDACEGVDNLRFDDVPDPEPGPGQVLLRVRFAALKPGDAFLAEARYPAKSPLPHILSRHGAGAQHLNRFPLARGRGAQHSTRTRISPYPTTPPQLPFRNPRNSSPRTPHMGHVRCPTS